MIKLNNIIEIIIIWYLLGYGYLMYVYPINEDTKDVTTHAITEVSPTCKVFLKIQKDFFVIFLPFLYLQGVECVSYVLTTYFAGLINEIHLAGVGLGCTVYNILMVSFMYGYSSVFETYGPQIYSSSNRSKLGVLLIKILIQGMIIFLFLLAPYVNLVHLLQHFTEADNVLEAEGKTIQSIAQQFILYSFAFGFLDYCVDIFNKYLMIQERHKMVCFSSTVYIGVYVLANYILVIVMRLRVSGLVGAMYIARGTNLVLQIGYCFITNLRGKLAWSGFSFHIFTDWWSMMRLGFSGILCLLADVGLFEVATFLSQFAGNVNLSVLVINLQIYMMVTPLILAHRYTSTILLGFELGHCDTDNILNVSKVLIVNAVLISMPSSLIIWFARYQIVGLFSKNVEVAELFGRIIWIASVYTIFDYVGSVLARGILVAFGKQRFTAILSSFTSYLVGIPFTAFIVFKTDYGAEGVLYVFLGIYVLKAVMIVNKMRFLKLREEIKASESRISELDSEDAEDIKNAYLEMEQWVNNGSSSKPEDDTQFINCPSGMLTAPQKHRLLIKFSVILIAAIACAAVGFIAVAIF